ncbi:MAG TPA: SpoIIE family protein phosphatase, partial [Candidatus Ozemobacteraceae bacterium]|nr:SpoIIE family protein phosphatase [Candidatus Ozemobacteraceae bacterium]
HVGIDRHTFQYRYCLREYGALLRSGNLPIRLSAVNCERTARPVLDKAMDEEMTRHMATLAGVQRGIVREVRNERGVSMLWIGFPCRLLDGYTLVAKAPLESVTATVGELWRQLWMLAGMLLLAGALMAWLLTEQVLLPLRDVAGGIEAIARRDFRHRVPVRSSDELGEIAGLMNTVTEGMRDLEIARVVQESLFPGGGIAAGEFEIFGLSRAMTDIGGDYFDYMILDERHLVGLIGDVAGHGVSAALIMGMAKSAFTLLATPGRPLDAFLNEFNELLVRQGTKRRHMMTMFCFALDLQTNRLTALNSGHNFPLLFRAETGCAEEMKLIGHPLGVRKKVLLKGCEIDLAPGDGILFYTDGLIESCNRSGDVVGYARAADWVADLASKPGMTAESIVGAVFDSFDAFRGDQTAGDDVTVVCLQRRPLVSDSGKV